MIPFVLQQMEEKLKVELFRLQYKRGYYLLPLGSTVVHVKKEGNEKQNN